MSSENETKIMKITHSGRNGTGKTKSNARIYKGEVLPESHPYNFNVYVKIEYNDPQPVQTTANPKPDPNPEPGPSLG